MIKEFEAPSVLSREPSATRADALRREGRLDEALEVARACLRAGPDRLDARLALALVQLDRGRVGDARAELEWLLVELDTGLDPIEATAESPFDGDVGVPEVARAVDDVQTDAPEPMRKGRRIAESVLDGAHRIAEPGSPMPPPLESPAFQTETMALLLERQGDAAGALEIRERVQDAGAEAALPRRAVSRRERTLAVLEGWLANLGRGAA